ncbi:hypothetical protein K1719_009028 [Acacia pycnantha]|nr:hypothetical protein K1719_009028 [Acacia pycnantha]
MFWALIAWTMELGKDLDKFLKAASDTQETVLHYEFMQDYKAHAAYAKKLVDLYNQNGKIDEMLSNK